MASAKAERPLEGFQAPVEKNEKEPATAKAGAAAPKAHARKLAPKKAHQNPREPKKRAKGGKAAAKK